MKPIHKTKSQAVRRAGGENQAPVRKTLAHRAASQAQPSPPKSEYNPRGLKVADILNQIHRAFEYDTKIPMGLINPIAFSARRPRLVSYAASPLGTEPRILSGGQMVVELRNLMDADQMAIRANDATLAQEIQLHPTLALLSDEHADAIARWMYGKVHGVRNVTRKRAQKHLKSAFPSRPGAPIRFRGDIPLLRAAYKDMVAYGDGLRTCLRDTIKPDVLAAHFPDYAELGKYYGCDPLTLIGVRARDIPTGIKLAESVFADLVDWSHTQIQKKLLRS